jgi:hypothetical protein
MTKIWTPRTALNAALPQWTRPRTRSWGTPITPNLTAPEHQMECSISRCHRSPTTPGKRTTPASKSQGLTLNICQVRDMTQNPDRPPPATHCLPTKLASGMMTQWKLWRLHLHNTTPTSRRTLQLASSALKRRGMINHQTHHQNGHANIPACRSQEWESLGVSRPDRPLSTHSKAS